jgi:peptidoglycan/xylan/chitin deacetylase (PgdA/CDA1 family)
MYHRVETLAVDPWQLAVSPARFAAQVRALMAARRVVPLSWLAAELAAGRRPRHVAAVTFDDGYGDVFRNARPILEAAGCPATVFIATGALGSPEGFWWDILARILLETPALPETLEFRLDGTPRQVRIGAKGLTNGADRAAALAEIHALLRPAEPEARDAALAELAAAAGTDATPRPRDLAMSPEEMVAMAAGGLIEIGAHTVSHPPMTALSPAAQLREAADSRRRCEELLGRPVTGFAYPYGDHDATSKAAVREAGLTHACSVVSRPVGPGTDPFAIPRLLAADWEATEFHARVLAHG